MVYAIEINSTTFAPAKFATIGGLLNLVIPLITIVAALLLLAMLMMGGFTWLTAGGDHKRVEEAQKRITFAILGFIIIVIAYLVTKIVGYITGVTIPL